MTIDWAKGNGLLPAIVQHWRSGAVLMLGYMNADALAATLDSGKVTFFSRSKGRLWTKGETSGNFLLFKSVRADCDRDALLLQAEPAGPTCHLGTASCFGDEAGTDGGPQDPVARSSVPGAQVLDARTASAQMPSAERGNAGSMAVAQTVETHAVAFLAELDALVADRERERPAGSYTTRLFDAGIRRIAQKVGEEGVEAALAATAQDDSELVGEAADLMFHLIVLLRARGKSLGDVVRVLQARHAEAARARS